jgi:GNAT superfamily N-acetyltransferase
LLDINIREVDLPSYEKFFGRSLPAISGHYARRSAREKRGFMLGAFCGGHACGVLSGGEFEEKAGSISRVDTVEAYRLRGVCKALVSSALSRFKSRGVESADTSCVVGSPCWEAMDSFLRKTGFEETVSQTSVLNYCNSETEAEFREFRERFGDRLTGRLLRRGYYIAQFVDATAVDVDALAKDAENMTGILTRCRTDGKTISRASFMVYKNGEPAACSVLSEFDGGCATAVVSALACRERYRKTGAGLWPLLRSIEEILAGREYGYKKVIYTFLSDNVEMANLQKSPLVRFSGRISSVTRLYRMKLTGGSLL